jgi:hypothetical protein
MMIPDSRNNKGEDFAKFAAEMHELAKRPELRPHLTSTERRRVEREEKRAAEEEQKRKEAWLIEAKRRDDITAQWFNLHMRQLCPQVWAKFQRAGKAAKDEVGAQAAVLILSNAGWDIVADMTTAEKPGHLPTPVTVCSIRRHGKIKRIERLVWEEPKPIPSKIIKPGEA